jgi:hypothetical protein
MLRAITVLAALGLAACSSAVQPAPAGPAPFDPVGLYDFRTEVQGITIPGTISFARGTEGQLTATVATDMTGSMVVPNVVLEGRRAELRAETSDGSMFMVVEFGEENRITGGWELSTGLSGSMAGQRRPPTGQRGQ